MSTSDAEMLMPIARVLLVDDDELVRYHTAMILEDNGFEIGSASSAPRAVSAITADVLLRNLKTYRGARVLLVDDDELVRYHIARVLEDNGFEVGIASSASEALSAITTDVLLKDLQTSRGVDGLTIVSAMRHANPRAVAILMSGFHSIDAAADAVLFQADEMLVRSFDCSSRVNIRRR